jgi:hypothetical protein
MAVFQKAHSRGGRASYYDRLRDREGKQKERMYHAFSLSLVVFPTGESFWRLIVGPWAIAFGHKFKK